MRYPEHPWVKNTDGHYDMILVGYGRWGKNLARIFKDQIKTIVDIDQKKLDQARCLYQDALMSTSLFDAVAANRSFQNIALVANTASDHYDTALFLLENNYDLWIEKPVVLSIKQIDVLIKTAEKNSCVVLIDHIYCYDDNIQKIKHIGLGDPIYYRSFRLANGPVRKDITALYDLAIHDLGIINFLYPDLQIQETKMHITSKDHGILELKFSNNFTAIIEYSWSFPIKKRSIIVKGSNMIAVHDSVDQNLLRIFDRNSNVIDSYVTSKETLLNVKEHFLKCVESRTLPLTNLFNSKKIMRWIL